MDEQKLIEFLTRAREKSSYETVGESGEKKLPDGTRIIGPYTEGLLSYTDKYKGFLYFEGAEEMAEGGKLIWRRKYAGGVTDKSIGYRQLSYRRKKIVALKIYDVLKTALQDFPRDQPFKRGPNYVDMGEYEYFDNKFVGTLSVFKGEELIFRNTKEVYSLLYWGGLQLTV